MSPYRESSELRLPKGINLYSEQHECLEAMFLYSSLDGTQEKIVEQFKYNFTIEPNSNGIFELSEGWEKYSRYAPFKTGKDNFDDFIYKSHDKYLIFKNVIIPWQRLDKVMIVSREMETISFKWKVE